jgi:hypothetical protein
MSFSNLVFLIFFLVTNTTNQQKKGEEVKEKEKEKGKLLQTWEVEKTVEVGSSPPRDCFRD